MRSIKAIEVALIPSHTEVQKPLRSRGAGCVLKCDARACLCGSAKAARLFWTFAYCQEKKCRQRLMISPLTAPMSPFLELPQNGRSHFCGNPSRQDLLTTSAMKAVWAAHDDHGRALEASSQGRAKDGHSSYPTLSNLKSISRNNTLLVEIRGLWIISSTAGWNPGS